MRLKRKYNKVSEQKKQAVLEWFYNQFDNSSVTISDVTGVSIKNVNRILDNDLKKLKNETRHKD